MLYKKICHATLCIYALLSSPSHSSAYYVNSNPSANYQCPKDATECHIYCNNAVHGNINTYDCNNADRCHFHCDEQKCGELSTINAQNATNLYITQAAAGDQCLKSAIINTPNYGNAYFTTQAKKGFKGMNVFAGDHTNEITIDASNGIDDDKNGEYKEMNVYAATATYVSVAIGANLEWTTATIQCPVHSAYNGPAIAPCIISAAGASLTDLTIIAPEGTPKDVYVDGCSQCTNVKIVCNDNNSSSSSSTYPFNKESACWWSAAPTTDPTTTPTIMPSNHPTVFTASDSPSTYPTVEPSVLSTTYSPSPTETVIISVTMGGDSHSDPHSTDRTAHSGEDLEDTQQKYYWGKATDWIICIVVFVLFWMTVGSFWWIYTNPAAKARERKKTIQFMNQSISNKNPPQ